jgi:membrane protease YdiL (CAAX protease family)
LTAATAAGPPSESPLTPRAGPALPPFPASEFAVPGAILVALCVAELVTAAVDARFGLVAHAGILSALVAMGARTKDSARRELYWTLTLAPIIRLGSLSLPLGRLPLLWWYPLIGVPIFAAAALAAVRLGYTRAQIGLSLRLSNLPFQLALVPLGFVLGVGEYLIFRPAPIIEHFTFSEVVTAGLVLLVFTGFEEELVFRGIMQRAALRSLGRWGLVYVSGVFAALHIGYLSVLDFIFVFLVGLLFAVIVLRTRTLFGVTLAHGAVNVSLFLLIPYIAPVFLGTGYGDLVPLPVPSAPP